MNKKLVDLKKKSYSPYSNFSVSAIVVTKDGKEFTGVNIENAAYGSSMCAERVALFKAFSEGYRKEDIKELHLAGDAPKYTMPCGACRQVMSELMDLKSNVICYDPKGNTSTHTVDELLPFSFTSEDL